MLSDDNSLILIIKTIKIMNKPVIYFCLIVVMSYFLLCCSERINKGIIIPLNNGSDLTVVKDNYDYRIVFGKEGRGEISETDYILVCNEQMLTIYYFFDKKSEIIVVNEGDLLCESQIRVHSSTINIRIFSHQDYLIYRNELRDPEGFLPVMGKVSFNFGENYLNHFKDKIYRW